MATKLESLSTKLQSALDLANSLPDAITLDELTNPGSAATMLEGTEMLDAQGKKVTGTIESKDSSDLTATLATVTVPAGYYASQATKSVQDLEWDNMYHDVNPSTGVVEFSQNTVSGGYVQPRTDITSSLQLPTQPATTITPTKSSQTAVEAGKYTTGAVTVGPIPDQYQDVSGVTATAATTLTGKKFVNSSGTLTSGTMPNNGTLSSTIDGLETKSVSIPMGYTDGGTVALDSTIDDTADSQAAQIAEIKAMLEGKSVSGGTQTYETCTVNLSCTDDYTSIRFVNVLCFENGSVVQKSGYISSSNSAEGLLSQDTQLVSVNNVICGSNVLVIPYSSSVTLTCRNVVGLSQSWTSHLGSVLDNSYTRCYEFSVIASAGETASVEFYMYD